MSNTSTKLLGIPILNQAIEHLKGNAGNKRCQLDRSEKTELALCA